MSAMAHCVRSMGTIGNSGALSRLFQVLLTAIVVTTPFIAAAQGELRVVGDTDPVQVYVSVTANDGSPIGGLSAGAFQLGEDGASQAITTTISTTNLPVTTVFVMDYSISLRTSSAIAPMEQAVKGFIDLMGAGDEAAVIKFNGDIGVVVSQDLTADKTLLKTAVDTDPGGQYYTNLYDAINKANDIVNLSTNTTGTRSIVVLTDGDDNYSTISLDALSTNLDTGNAAVFTVGFGDPVNTSRLQGLADGTGGTFTSTNNDTNQFAAVYTQISDRLNNEYLLTYPSATSDCNVHRLQVQVATSEGTKTYDANFRRCFSTDPLPVVATGSSGGGIGLWEVAAFLLLGLLSGFAPRARRPGMTPA
ncbi:MAG: hypothetical protein FD165_618 [Gammaproteobacteria bacterium]|nr:MAG: hypothetical protein FD165_618 [Gammaproteobacteria bacterium]TND02119.1 MAG: hypothetical protein FD120_2283 [Gammaproteobacteria bacterium]